MKSNETLKTEKLFNRQYMVINLIAFLFFLGDFILTTTVPLYSLTIGGTPSTAGIFMAIIAFTALIIRPFIGSLMDIKTRKLVLTIGTISLAFTSVFYGLSTTIAMLLFFAIFHGISISSITTSAPTIVADVTPASKLSEGISLYGISTNVTLAVGPIIALYLFNHFGYSSAFKVALGLALLGIALTSLINYEKKQQKITDKRIHKQKRISLITLFEKKALKPALYQLLIAFGMSTTMTFIPIYGKSRGIPNIGLFFTFYACASIIVSFFTGKITSRYGARRIFIPSLVLQLVAFLFLGFAHALPLMLVAAVLYGFGSGSGLAIISIITMEAVAPDRRGAAYATTYAAMDIGIALGSMILGIVSTQFGFTATFMIAAAMIGVDMILFGILDKAAGLNNAALDESGA